MDLALAHAVAATIPNGWDGLDAAQRVALTYSARNAKEALFGQNERRKGADRRPRPGIEGDRRVDQDGIESRYAQFRASRWIFPRRRGRPRPPIAARRLGLTEIGLPYASDAAITRHLARFLGRQAGSLHAEGGQIRPSAVLFNGGRLPGEAAARPGRGGRPLRMVGIGRADAPDRRPGPRRRPGRDVLRARPPRQGDSDPRRRAEVVLRWHRDRRAGRSRGEAADQGPLRGADGDGGRDRARRPRPRNSASSSASPPSSGSSPPPPAATTPPARSSTAGPARNCRNLTLWKPRSAPPRALDGDVVPVRLHAHVTEVGTLDLWCQSTRGEGRWKLEYNVREGSEG